MAQSGSDGIPVQPLRQPSARGSERLVVHTLSSEAAASREKAAKVAGHGPTAQPGKRGRKGEPRALPGSEDREVQELHQYLASQP